jgi:preprotein translocase subunit SecD
MKPSDDPYWDEEAMYQRYFAKKSPQPKPKPATKLAEQPIEVVRKTAQQTIEKLAEREREEAKRCEREADNWQRTVEYRRWLGKRQQAAMNAWAERRLADKEISNVWDPCGLYGEATLASPLD